MELLQGMEACPQRLMLENVQGFEGSDTCARLMEVLALRGYQFPAQAAPQDLSAAAQPSSIAQYLEQLSAREVADFAVEDRVAAAAARQPLDVATAASTATITFTKGYGRQIGKAGPYLLLSEDGVTVEWGGRARFSFVEGGQKLRYFTPREMLRVAGFPESFVFSPGTSNRAAYKLIGNSINVTVVSRLLSWLLAQG
ncbi:S-adenosyl-L-methionine-dependent methyltransferase [Tribonema minus]|uniref:tRNA (cytosine(38)-C(5))-methyltransferase n=1 Tax=Tribonema minus TaxID=303371 RepID=A0A835YUF4_9STRA|nr:S-adenosyl-L-methionine-dependent methyltransferase [Tribonema minus]